MKRFVLLLIMIFMIASVNCQMKQDVISSAGGYSSSGSMSLSWTLGETIVQTFSSGDLILTHGFIQPDTAIKIITEIEDLDVLVNLKLFPNPSSEILNIQFESFSEGEVILVIVDSQGRLIKRDVIVPPMTLKQINMQDIPAGTYYLRLTKGKLANVYKVVKL